MKSAVTNGGEKVGRGTLPSSVPAQHSMLRRNRMQSWRDDTGRGPATQQAAVGRRPAQNIVRRVCPATACSFGGKALTSTFKMTKVYESINVRRS